MLFKKKKILHKFPDVYYTSICKTKIDSYFRGSRFIECFLLLYVLGFVQEINLDLFQVIERVSELFQDHLVAGASRLIYFFLFLFYLVIILY